MMDAGQDAGFSQGVGDGDFHRSNPHHGVQIRTVDSPADHSAERLAQGDADLPSVAVAGGFDLAALHALGGQMRSVPLGVPHAGLSGTPHGITQGGDGGGSEQAMTIARQVADMAQGLAALADRLVGQGPAGPADSIDVAEADCVAFLESQFRIRRLRARHLPALSLGEPAWDILLDLAVAQYWRRETSVTSLCIAADVPSTTALRWINSMTREGLIVRRPCQRDGRRSFLAIAPETYQAMLAMAADSLRTEQRVRARYQRAP